MVGSTVTVTFGVAVISATRVGAAEGSVPVSPVQPLRAAVAHKRMNAEMNRY